MILMTCDYLYHIFSLIFAHYLNSSLIKIILKLFNHYLSPQSYFPTESTQIYLTIPELNIGLVTLMTESIKILNAYLDFFNERRTIIFLEF